MIKVEKTFNVETGEETIIERELNAEELLEQKAVLADQAKRDAEQALKEAARQLVLDKLGLSADEVAALLG